VTWLPFDLHPEYPPEGIPRRQLHARYGEEFHERLRQWFERDGLAYNPPPEVVPNTMNALRVTELARDHGLHEAVHDRLMKAYWEEARNIGDAEELRALAGEAGLDGEQVDEVLVGDAYRDRVRSATAQAQSIGITGIPAFLLDRRLLVLGAQPRDVFRRAFAELTGSGPDAAGTA
jgi:predicted DsbA family dithiol-disulfide isomerase